MKKIIFFLILAAQIASCVYAWGSREYEPYTPEVRYIAPGSESTVDLTKDKVVTFKWKPVPIPGGGRALYKFELFKGFDYERIMDKELARDAFFIDVPAAMFENGFTYTWQVKQRDERTRIWSTTRRWSFVVSK